MDLANFMGHEEKIHREHYRMPVVHREILQISRLLQSASGKNENKINLNDEEESDEDANNVLKMTWFQVPQNVSTSCNSETI